MASEPPTVDTFRPNYWRVWSMCARNSMVREMTFRGNFITEIITRAFWFAAQLVLFDVIYRQVDMIEDWTRPSILRLHGDGDAHQRDRRGALHAELCGIE